MRIFYREQGQHNREELASFIGLWFGMLPLALSDITGGLTAYLSRTANAPQLSLMSSVKGSCLGGVCSSDTTFSSMLRRYFTDMLPEEIYRKWLSPHRSTWLDGVLENTTNHHQVQHSNDAVSHPVGNPLTLAFKTSAIKERISSAVAQLHKECEKVVANTKSISGLLLHLENLGHDEAAYVEGLNIELLPFQRQTLCWALEREKTPGGFQSFLWSQLPKDDSTINDLYFSPLLHKVKTEKPKLARGGIIADEMGLGKTVRD